MRNIHTKIYVIALYGTKITFEKGCFFIKTKGINSDIWENCDCYKRTSDDLQDFKDGFGALGKIIKIEEPSYTTVYEVKKEILDEKEKEYLSNVIRPFRKQVISIKKEGFDEEDVLWEYISIGIKSNFPDYIDLPNFRKGTMYKGMEINKEYSLEELGL